MFLKCCICKEKHFRKSHLKPLIIKRAKMALQEKDDATTPQSELGIQLIYVDKKANGVMIIRKRKTIQL